MEKPFLRQKHLYKFLCSHNALHKFVKNVVEQHPSAPAVMRYEEDGDLINLLYHYEDIDRAMLWSRTPEAHRFWENLHYSETSSYDRIEKDIHIMNNP